MFHGMGAVTFALFATATLMLRATVADHLVIIGQARYAAAAVAAIGVGAVVVDASPSLGRDLGGPPALLPAVILLVLAILAIKLTWRLILAITGGVGAFLVLLGLLNWLRPPQYRSHLGRFVQTILDGGAWDIIVRKLEQNITLLFSNPLSLLIPVVLVVFASILARPTWWAAAPPSFLVRARSAPATRAHLHHGHVGNRGRPQRLRSSDPGRRSHAGLSAADRHRCQDARGREGGEARSDGPRLATPAIASHTSHAASGPTILRKPKVSDSTSEPRATTRPGT
jgi:hypothetical protein